VRNKLCYPGGCKHTAGLVLDWLTPNEPLHAVVAIDLERDRIFMVTVYRPGEEEWEDDWRTRKK